MTSRFTKLTTNVQAASAYIDTHPGAQGILSTIMSFPQRFGSIPIQPLSVLKQAKSYLGMRDEALKIGLFIDPRMTDETIDLVVNLFEPENEKTRVLAHVLTPDMTLGEHVSYDALVFVVARADIAVDMVAKSVEQNLPVMVAVEEGLRSDAATAYSLSILDVISARKPDLLVNQTANWFAANLSDHRMALASDFTFMRPSLADTMIANTAKQNAIIAAVFFLPGADMPVMLINQIKMAMQLAFIYGEELTVKRIAEVFAVVGMAYLSRAISRSAGGDLPKYLKLPVNVAVAYATTLGIGKLLELWLLKAPEIPVLETPLPELPSVGDLIGKVTHKGSLPTGG